MKRKNKSKISFDRETNPELLKKVSVVDQREIKRKEQKSSTKTTANKVIKKHTQTKRKINELHEDVDEKSIVNEEAESVPESKKDESRRSKKRKKHEVLLVEKKIKSEVTHQERTLNYLSKWKHSRGEWKFEKNRQAWLKQNMFDVDKVPEEFWETLVEYFSNAKGNIRKALIEDALKIIETRENKAETEEDSDDVIINRARAIIQSLEE